jgi:hypothetical protein
MDMLKAIWIGVSATDLAALREVHRWHRFLYRKFECRVCEFNRQPQAGKYLCNSPVKYDSLDQ